MAEFREKEIQARKEGGQAYWDGLNSTDDNPYSDGILAREWFFGFDDAAFDEGRDSG